MLPTAPPLPNYLSNSYSVNTQAQPYRLYKKDDPEFLGSSLLFDKGPLSILEIVDKNENVFIHSVFKNEIGEVRMRMSGNSKLPDLTFKSKGILDNVSLANTKSY